MPHQCTECGRTFADGSKQMLSGCPDCGGNKFQFRPGSAIDPDERGGGPADASDASGGIGASDGPGGVGDEESARTANVGGSASRSGSGSESGSGPRSDPDDATEIDDDASGMEDHAQADARSAVVSSDELSVTKESDSFGSPEESAAADSGPDVDPGRGENASDAPADHTDTDPAPDHDPSPELAELREELNDQFESIRIVSPGQYELNLMELYDRQEYIISLQEDGRYVIEMPGDWGPDED